MILLDVEVIAIRLVEVILPRCDRFVTCKNVFSTFHADFAREVF